MAPRPNVPRPAGLRVDDGLDDTDRQLLTLIEADARMPNNRLADKARIAPSTALARIRGLVERRVIRGFHADIDPTTIGRNVQAVVAVRLRSHDRRHIDGFASAIPKQPEIIQAFHVAGSDDYLLHVAVPSAEYLREWIIDNVTTHPAVANSQTNLVFSHERVNAGPLTR